VSQALWYRTYCQNVHKVSEQSNLKENNLFGTFLGREKIFRIAIFVIVMTHCAAQRGY
jgi:hypothetical protein